MGPPARFDAEASADEQHGEIPGAEAGREDAGQLVEVADSYTLIPQDQPAQLARIIRDFGNRRGRIRQSAGDTRA